MLGITIKRLLQGVFVVLCVTVISFVLLRLIPGDPTKAIAPNASDEQRQLLRQEMGIDDSIPVQLKNYFADLIKGDLGKSYFQNETVEDIIVTTCSRSLILIGNTLVLALVLSLILGVLAARFAGSWIDKLVSSLSIVLQSMPNYWIATMLILIVGVRLGWLPVMGYYGYEYTILPSIILALPVMAAMMKSVRANMVESFRMDFVKAASARGIPRLRILFKYALRNSLIALLTALGSQLGFLVGSIVLIEYIFSFPGVGFEILTAINRRDYNLVQALIIILSSFFIVINMVIDIAYSYLDPRIRKAQGDL